jgi:hypothetical protein
VDDDHGLDRNPNLWEKPDTKGYEGCADDTELCPLDGTNDECTT